MVLRRPQLFSQVCIGPVTSVARRWNYPENSWVQKVLKGVYNITNHFFIFAVAGFKWLAGAKNKIFN